MLYKVVLTFESVDKMLLKDSVTDQAQATEHCCRDTDFAQKCFFLCDSITLKFMCSLDR